MVNFLGASMADKANKDSSWIQWLNVHFSTNPVEISVSDTALSISYHVYVNDVKYVAGV